MNRATPTQAWVILAACLFVSAMASLAAVLVAVQRPLVVVVQPAQPMPAGLAAPMAAPAAAPAAAPVAPAPPPVAVVAARVSAVPSLDDPLDSAWNAVPVTDLELAPQQVAAPMLETATVRRLRVQAARDDARIAWRLSWEAPQPADTVETSTFTDALAVQFPLAEGAPFTMGAKGKPVCVLHWKALWQKDVDKGFQDVQDLYPNAYSDMYWFAQGGWPFPVSKAFADPRSRQWLVGLAAGNPMSVIDRRQPLEELVAEGFGSSTHVPYALSAARGQWKDGRWTVVIDRPLGGNDDPLAVCLRPDQPSQVAFAVWDGHAGNVGGRKHWVGWIPFKVEP